VKQSCSFDDGRDLRARSTEALITTHRRALRVQDVLIFRTASIHRAVSEDVLSVSVDLYA